MEKRESSIKKFKPKNITFSIYGKIANNLAKIFKRFKTLKF